MSVETLDNIDELPDLTVEPVAIKEISENKREYFYNLANQQANYLDTEEKINDFIAKNFEEKSPELIFTVDCELRLIAYVRKLVTKQLTEHGIIRGEDEENDFNALVGEVIRDTLHSTEQGFSEPKFTVRITNLNNPEKLSFDTINPDKVPCRDWSRGEAKEIAKKLTGNEQESGPVGLGTSFLPGYVKLLGGEAYYADIEDEKGKKSYTLFHFEKQPEKKEDREEYTKEVRERPDLQGY
ncbi:MAG: hypothetical protein M1338_00615 [Patescibacteria group bacterium]|nr:hypothetical protein [Patescibacteria group bacterium]